MYSISEISKMFNLPISTLRYYDSNGLFPNLKRESGIRKFSDNEIETLRVIECLKKSGLEIKEIKLFMEWCKEGPSSYQKRLDLITKQKEHVENEIARMNKALDMLKFKTWYYKTLIQNGDENKIKEMIPNNLPNDIKEAYKNSHQD